MTTASHLFQNFGELPKKSKAATALGIEEVEDQKLQAFENGYQAGWEDAVKAQTDTGGHISAALAASLQDASFEYHEVRSSLTGAVQTILAEVLNSVLPKIAQDSLGAHIREQVVVMCQGALDKSIEISVAPQSESAVQSLLADDLGQPFVLTTDPLLTPAQAVLRLGADEREIDLGRLVDGINASVSTFFETEKPEATHG
mmetsp:Transcript_22361/g.35780  ORF Transcript_22361/g.35780 Transcript_22361/m.35780 type:complete len:201 (-) Transcript_22361:1361-1963(-)